MSNSRSGIVAILIFIVVVILIAGLVATLGLYNVAADNPDSALTRNVLAFVRERSIDARGEDTKVPPLDDPKMIANGAADYNAMCMGCHLGPGIPENEMRTGMNPKPPLLGPRTEKSAGEDFWIIKHGIKMTAMPAWGLTHSDQEIWNIVAFVEKLPNMSPQQYHALVASGHHDMDNMNMGHE